MLNFEQLNKCLMGQAVDEMNRLGPVSTEDQSASLSASVSVRYGRLTEVSTCVQVHVQVTNIEPCGVGRDGRCHQWSHRLGHRPEALGHPSFDSNGHD